MDTAVEMQNIVKKFGDFVANDGINLTVKKERFMLFWEKTVQVNPHL